MPLISESTENIEVTNIQERVEEVEVVEVVVMIATNINQGECTINTLSMINVEVGNTTIGRTKGDIVNLDQVQNHLE